MRTDSQVQVVFFGSVSFCRDGKSIVNSHYVECVATGPCPAPTSHRRLDEVHTFWHRCLENYQDADLFRTDLNAAIQAIRNVTFVLQKEMGKVEGFREWYGPWQTAMARTPILLWLVQARNQIVKEGDLVANSTTRARMVFDYNDAAAIAQERAIEFSLAPIELKPDVFATIPEIRHQISEGGFPDWVLEDGIIVLERRWVAEGFPSTELLNGLAYAFSFISSLLIDMDVQFTATAHDPHLDPETIGKAGEAYPDILRPACMVSTHETRTVTLRYVDGGTDVGGLVLPIDLSPSSSHELDQAFQKFGAMSRPAFPESALDYVDSFNVMARSVLESGEPHGWFQFYFRGAKMIHMETVAARDRADKYVIAQQIANLASRLQADGFLQVGEVWIGIAPKPNESYVPAGRQANRTEAVQIYAEISSGEVRGLLIPFKRSSFGVVTIDSTVTNDTPSNFALPLRESWRELRRGRLPSLDI